MSRRLYLISKSIPIFAYIPSYPQSTPHQHQPFYTSTPQLLHTLTLLNPKTPKLPHLHPQFHSLQPILNYIHSSSLLFFLLHTNHTNTQTTSIQFLLIPYLYPILLLPSPFSPLSLSTLIPHTILLIHITSVYTPNTHFQSLSFSPSYPLLSSFPSLPFS